MNNLKFIDELIKETEQSIRHWEKQLENYPNEEVFTKCLNKREKELQNLHQIKTRLEAWEIAKEKKVDFFHIEMLDTAESFNYDLLSQYQLTKEEFNKLKKALETYDE